MAININTTTPKLTRTVADTVNSLSADNDIIVPDSKPDILKILQMDAHAYITNTDAQSDRVLVSGTVDFSVIYLADTELKDVCSLKSSAVFSQVCEIHGVTSEMDVASSVTVSGIDFNLVNCRKLSLKAALTLNIKVEAGYSIEVISNIEGAETQGESISANNLACSSSQEAAIEENVDIPQGKTCPGEILKLSAKLTDRDIKPIQNKAVIRGTLLMTVLYTTDGKIDFFEHEIPFTEIIDAENLSPEMDVDYSVNIKSKEVSVSNEAENPSLKFSALLGFEIRGYETCEFDVVKDAFSPRSALDCKKGAIAYNTITHENCEEHFVKEILSLPDDFPEINTVYEVLAKPFIEDVKIEDGKVKLYGYLDTYVLYLSDDENCPVYSFKQEIDFSHAFTVEDCSSEPVSNVRLKHVTYTLSSRKEVEIRALLDICTRCIKEREDEIIYSAEEIAYTPPSRPSIIISFASKDDSLWSLAKKYNIKMSDIALANALDENQQIKEGMVLIIPK